MSTLTISQNHKHHSILPITLIFFLLCLVIAIILYPPIMIIGLDIAVVGGAILIVTVIANIWHHEIQRLASLMKDLEEYLHVHPAQQEECEQYYILSSVNQSLDTLKQKRGLTIEEKKQLHYLKKQKLINTTRLCTRGVIWAIKLLIPIRLHGYPTLIDNLKTIFKEPKFLALKMTIIIWLLFSLFIVLYILQT